MALPDANLTPTVNAMKEALSGQRVSTQQIVEYLLERHREYGDKLAATLPVRWPDRMRQVPVERCLSDVAALFLPPAHWPLHGRAVIAGVALADRDAGRAMIESGLFWRIANELSPPLVQCMSDEGAARLATIPMAATIGGRPPTVVAQPSAGMLQGLAFTPDCTGLLTIHSDADQVLLWRDGSPRPVAADDATTGGLVRVLKGRQQGGPEEWTKDGRRKVTATGGTVVVAESDGTEVARLPVAPTGVRINDDGTTVVTMDGNDVQVWDVRTGRPTDHFTVTGARGVVFAGDQLAVAGVDEVWVDGEWLQIGRGLADMGWRPDGQLLAVADEDGLVTLFNPQSQQVIGQIVHDPGLRAVTFSPDGRAIAAGGDRAVWSSDLAVLERRRFATYDADTARGDRDLLDIDNDVEAFATLIAARTLVPPLSIGLFGQWGSGKSFFMKRLRGRVREIAGEARDSGRVQQDVDFYKYIAQIEFNAWHYVEGNLWASLVQNIFENLHVEHENDGPTARQRRAARLLRTAEKRFDVATQEAVAAAIKVEKTALRVTQLKVAHEGRLRELEAERQRDVLRAVVNNEVAHLVSAAVAPFGIEPLTDAARDVADGYRRARQQVDGSLPIVAVLTDRHNPEARRFRRILVGIAIPGLLLVVAALSLRGAAVHVAGLVTGTAAVLGGAASGLRTIGQWVAKRREELSTAGKALQGDIDGKLDEQVKALADLAAEETVARATLEAALVAEEEARAALKQQKAENQMAPPELLGRLIQKRLEGGDYRKHLGVLALIREDFSDAADIVAENNRWLETNENLEEENHEGRVDRIVLYIDDLDRCPPRRVVEVLEAVHLLLAFPLFVVVVGVDPRWVLKSLEAHYWEILDSEDHEGSATPTDYVEKIFQVPYQLPDMTAGAARNMVAGLVPVVADASARPIRVRATPSPAPQSPQAAGPAATPAAARAPAERRDLTPGSLQVGAAELEAMQALAPIFGATARTTKRFVNLYRIVKVRAQLRPGFLRDMGPATEYRLVMFLLAVAAGPPEGAAALFEALRTGDQGKALKDLDISPRLSSWLASDEATPWANLPLAAYAPFVDDVKRFSFFIDASGGEGGERAAVRS